MVDLHFLLGCILSVSAGTFSGVNTEPGPAQVPYDRPTPPLPATAPIPEAVPTTQAKLPPRAEPWWSRDWMVSLEAATHAPVDVAVQAEVETPIRLRLSAAYGWVPSAYAGLLSGVAASASGDAQAASILNHTSYAGHTLRAQAGVRPFRSLGLYADFGYAQVDVDGALDLAKSDVPALRGFGGGYRAHTTLDMWLVEIGSQHELWGSVVMALAFGVMGTLDARTSIVSVNGAPTGAPLADAARQADSALKTYGIVPTFTLRLGFDFFAIHRWLPRANAHG